MVHFRFLPICLALIFIADISAFEFSCSFHNSKPVGEDYSIYDDEGYKWTNNEVPYVFDENTSTKDRQLIREQMDVIQANVPCIKFIEKQKEHFLPIQHLRIIVRNRMGCERIMTNSGWSGSFNITIRGGVNDFNRPRIDFINEARLTDCDDDNVRKAVGRYVIHELMHVFGIEHTQKRSDRKNYIEVNNSCIQNTTEARYQYKLNKNYPNESVKAEVPYRCNSVMHYKPNAFSTGCPTMKSISKDCVFEGNTLHNEVLPEDWKMLRIHIGCTSTSGQNGCENKDSRCDTWKKHCQGGKYEDWMKDNCCKTCSKGLECKDGDWNCDSDWDWDWN